MKLMVLDGNSILNRAYYGIRPCPPGRGCIPTRYTASSPPSSACWTRKTRRPYASPLTAGSQPSATGRTRNTRPSASPCPGAGHAAAGDEAGAFGHVRALL